METQNIFKSKFWKIALPLLIVFSAIYIFKNGYLFGQWLAK